MTTALSAPALRALTDLAFAGPTVKASRPVRSLAAAGLVHPDTDHPDLYRLTTEGALLALSHLAGWHTPADPGDGTVVTVCARCALAKAEDDGAPAAMGLAVVNGLLEAAGFRPLEGDEATPFRSDPAVDAELREALTHG